MITLTRREFVDLCFRREDLDALTDLWLAWAEQCRQQGALRALENYHGVQLRLWGFPRPEREKLRQLLEQKLAELPRLQPTIALADPDYLEVNTPFLDFSQPCSLGMWQGLVDYAAFVGLVLILGLNVHYLRGRTRGA